MQLPARSWNRARALALAAALAGLASATAATAATINVVCSPTPGGVCTGTNLNQIMENAIDGDIVSVGPGTYPVMATTFVPADKFRIRRSITSFWSPSRDWRSSLSTRRRTSVNRVIITAKSTKAT